MGIATTFSEAVAPETSDSDASQRRNSLRSARPSARPCIASGEPLMIPPRNPKPAIVRYIGDVNGPPKYRCTKKTAIKLTNNPRAAADAIRTTNSPASTTWLSPNRNTRPTANRDSVRATSERSFSLNIRTSSQIDNGGVTITTKAQVKNKAAKYS
jgi:hypothetical protein